MHRHETDAGVLVPGIGAPSTVACLQSLGSRGIPAVVASETPETPAASSTYCDDFVRVPDPSENLRAYGDALLELASRSDVRTIIPVREEDVYVLANRKDAFTEVVETNWPDFETLRRVQDRVELFAAADAAGVKVPETAVFDQWDDWERDTIVKPRYTVAAPAYLGSNADVGSIGSTEYQIPGAPPDPQALVEERGHMPLVQERIDDSREFAFFALYDEGEPVATFQHCQRRGWKYCGGPSAYRETVYDQDLEDAGRAILDELEWHGLAMVEFLRDEANEEYKLMEINPRFWSSLPFSVRAGADFPYYYWQQALGEPIEDDASYEVGIGGHLLRGELSHVHSVLTEEYPMVERPSLTSTLADVVTSLVREPRFDYAVADDPAPFFQDGLNLLRAFRDSRSDPEPVVKDEDVRERSRSNELLQMEPLARDEDEAEPPSPTSQGISQASHQLDD